MSRHSGAVLRRHTAGLHQKNLVIAYRSLDGKLDRIPSVVAELVQLKVDVLVLGEFSAIRAAKQATKTTIPIVMVTTRIRLRPE